MSETNRFGGGNPDALYTPMTDVEQEILARLVEAQTIRVWAPRWHSTPLIPTRVGFGDKRIQVQFRITFPPPLPPTRIPSIDLELRTADGLLLMAKPYPLMDAYGKPLLIGENVFFDLVWDIAIDHMDPKLVKSLKPGAIGLTTRRLDKETGNRTLTGNMDLPENDRALLHTLDQAEAKVRDMDPESIQKLKAKLPAE